MLALYAPLVAAVVATAVLGVVVGRLRPAHGARLTAAVIGTAFLTITVSAWVTALGFLTHVPVPTPLVGWCSDHFAAHGHVSPWEGMPAAGLALWTTTRLYRVLRRWHGLRGRRTEALHIVASDRPLAYAQPGAGGGVVVSTGMLEALTADEQLVLLAHERSHVQNRHDRLLVVGSVAEGLPVLRSVAKRLRQALERWADEDAAEVLGDRRLVARAIARAALAGHDQPVLGLAVHGGSVPRRVEALMRPPARRAAVRAWTAAAALIGLITVLASVVQFHHLLAVATLICAG